MSDSDDTDVLLLIPPDLFIVPSSASEEDLVTASTKPGVVSEIIEQVQHLESRISAIESRDSSIEIAVSQSSLLDKLSPKSRRSVTSAPTTPFSTRKNRPHHHHHHSNTQSSSSFNSSWNKHDNLTTMHANIKQKNNNTLSPFMSKSARRSLFSCNSSRKSTESVTKTKVDDMNLVEIEEMLREIELNEQSSNVNVNNGSRELASSVKFHADLMSNDDSTQYADPDKLFAEFKLWKTTSNDEEESKGPVRNDGAKGNEQTTNGTGFRDKRNTCSTDLGTTRYTEAASEMFDSLNYTMSKMNASEPVDSVDFYGDSVNKTEDEQIKSCRKTTNDNINGACLLKSERLLALSDFWEHDNSKSQEEVLRIKLEEEKLRREHCEYFIQKLQKKLLEQQEKVAVAIQIDNKKNSAITHFHNSWDKLKQKYQQLETEFNNSQSNLKSVTDKYQSEITDLQTKITKCQGELSQALDLAAGYKEKSDTLVKEKVDLIKSHADELENYKTLIQQKEKGCEQIREDYNKLLEKYRQLEELLQSVQQDLNKERMKNNEVRNEMAAIHQALDTCGAELTVLRQEKENLQLKLKEETSRCHNLEQNKLTLLSAIEAAKKSEKQAKDETRTLLEQQEKVRCELRDVYQKQLDEVVKAKQQEFQTQLDSAEAAFQTELDARQRAIAECAARKILTVIDKHKLEINLIEEKHREEKRLYELQLAQVAQRTSMLEAQLNSQQASKNQLVEQLHSVMQRQWQQAVRIIAGGNGENAATSLQKINVDKFFELKNPLNNEALLSQCKKSHQDPVRLEATAESRGNKVRDDRAESLITLTSNDDIPTNNKKDPKSDLRGYIQMILDMQQSSDDILKSRLTNSTVTPPLVYREVPKKHYVKKELSIMSEDSVTWQPISEASVADTSEYVSIPQKLGKDQPKIKPPWK